MRKIILFELNEVPFKVIDWYCQAYPASTLARILPKCRQYETYTDDQGHLHPWTTWPTFHRGISNEFHGIKDFGEDLSALDEQYPPVWKMLVKNNLKVGVFASMHTYPLPDNVQDYDFFVPDPFAAGSECHPKALEPFQAFNLAMARRSGLNVDKGLALKPALRLAMQLPKLGIRPATLSSTLGQLVDERAQPWKSTRRRTYQTVLAFDIFMKLLKKHQPHFVSYLSNHVAATMHRYWAASFPEDYKVNNLSQEWLATYNGEIDFAMHKFDGFLRRLVQFIDSQPEYKLVVASSMGQEATKAESQLTTLMVKDMNKLMEGIGMQHDEWAQIPAMHPQYNVCIPDEVPRERFVSKFSQIQANGEPIHFRQKDKGFISMDFGHPNLEEDSLTYKGLPILPDSLGLANEAVDQEANGTAYHIPEGSMFVYDPASLRKKNLRMANTNTKSFAPSLLRNFEIEVPDYMKHGDIDVLL